jgi:hypothetical protein
VSNGYYPRGAFNEYRVYLRNPSAYRISCIVSGQYRYPNGTATLQGGSDSVGVILDPGETDYVAWALSDRNLQMVGWTWFPCRVF